jgi:hypothetical protein
VLPGVPRLRKLCTGPAHAILAPGPAHTRAS